MDKTSMFNEVVFSLGPLNITTTVITTWGIMLFLCLFSWAVTNKMSLKPGKLQIILEAVVETIESAISGIAPKQAKQLLPFIGSLWIFLVVANLVGLIPKLHSPTGDLSTTTALALLVFFSVHWYGIRNQGVKGYLKHYLSPSPILLPFHLISEITRTVALAVRLFGNIMSLEMAALLILMVAGFLAPIPILMLHIIEALVQAYIFGMLALVYVASGIQTQELRMKQKQQGVNHD